MIDITINEDGSEITVESDNIGETLLVERTGRLAKRNGVIVEPDVEGYIADWLADKDIPNDLGMQDAIELLADMTAKNYEITDLRDDE